MITALSISNFVLIDRLSLGASTGFTGLTGETGAGKSIILDALGMLLGLRPAKRFVRAGAQQATIIATFDVGPEHYVWQKLKELGIHDACDEGLTLKRVIPAIGSARSYVNEQALSAGNLAEIGRCLIEIHSQHAASDLLKPSYHRDMLDRFAGNGALLEAYTLAWQTLAQARAHREAVEAKLRRASEDRDLLVHMTDELESLAPVAGEALRLANERTQRMQAGRIIETVGEAIEGLEQAGVETQLASTAAALERLSGLPGFNQADGEDVLPCAVHAAAETFERASIEAQEALNALRALSRVAVCDERALETVEARLFALKAAARKYQVEPDDLGAKHAALRAELALIDAGEAGLAAARAKETDAAARWRTKADQLSRARKAAAKRMQRAVMDELVPLKLGGACLQIKVTPLPEGQADAKGSDCVMIEVETNPGAGFAPLHKIASGGELARFSLALKCAAAEAGGGVSTLIFDEADQGVGGAVAAAIGERLVRLSRERQVFAVTHSPQVAAAAQTQWRIEKSSARASKSKKSIKTLGKTRARVLDAETRLEEIARMLSGSIVTPEARAAASRLLEG